MKPLTSEELKWIGFDFDDTIASNSGLPDFILQEPMAGTKQAIDELVSKGWKIIIYTARPWSQYNVIEHWLNTHQIPFRSIVCGKMLLRWMVDDRNIEFNGDWGQVLTKIK